MNEEAFEGLLNEKLSVATSKNKRDGTPESYIGFLEKIGDDYIILDFAKASYANSGEISKVIISLQEVIGVWVYKSN